MFIVIIIVTAAMIVTVEVRSIVSYSDSDKCNYIHSSRYSYTGLVTVV